VGLIRGATFVRTLFKIDWLVAFFTRMFTVELIGKDFYFRTAILAFADK
jgi:hypothetical protein